MHVCMYVYIKLCLQVFHKIFDDYFSFQIFKIVKNRLFCRTLTPHLSGLGRRDRLLA